MQTTKVLDATTALMLVMTGFALADGMTTTTQPAMSTKPLQLALVAPTLQLVPEDQSIDGLRLEIYGRNVHVHGVDIGLIHEATGDYHGVQFGVANIVHRDFVGLQLAGIYSETKQHIGGAQVGIVNRAASMSGIQIGLVNFADDMTGFQFGLFNEISSKQTLPVLPLINAKF